MYKYLLCWRYLRTRYIALASIISVTLGVATLIVVNCVMHGFSREMQGRIHGILSDVVFESHNLDGFYDPQAHMERIKEVAGEYIAGMTPTVAVPAMLAYEINGHAHTRAVSFIGVDETSYGTVSDFNRYLKHPKNRQRLSFELFEGGYDLSPADTTPTNTAQADAAPNDTSGWPHRRHVAEEASRAPAHTIGQLAPQQSAQEPETSIVRDGWKYTRVRPVEKPAEAEAAPALPGRDNPFGGHSPRVAFDPATQIQSPLILGIGLARVDAANGGQKYLVRPGDDVQITVPTAGTPPKGSSATFTVVDFYESEMNEYDSNFIFVPLAQLQKMRGMFEPQTGVGYVTAIQIKLHNEADCDQVRDLLRAAFPPSYYGVQTWRDKQGPLLAAVAMQTLVLNILLFLIIAVAGFGILATFCMIVAEKSRDIGILKSLGASSDGILATFLGYGLSLGIVGSSAGLLLGLLFVANINRIADLLARLLGRQVFDPTIYYFREIPTVVEPLTLVWIVLGAMTIAVVASIIPAIRASWLKPVEALRHE